MIKIVVDSGCDFTPAMKNKDGINIELVPLSLQLGETQYIDDANLDMPNFLEDLANNPRDRKTAAPSPELFYNAYKGDESVFAITISSNLSGSYNSAMTAKNMYLEEIGDKFIHVIDSFSASVGETLIALELKKLIDLGLSAKEILPKITNFVDNLKTYFILEHYETVVNSGRMNPYVAKLASLLNIIPICGAQEGKMALRGQARGQKKAFNKLIELMQADNVNFSERILAITHINNLEKALELKEVISQKIKFKDILITEGSGLCSLYADNQGLILAF